MLRPSNEHSESIHFALAEPRAAGYNGASNPVGIEPDGRECLEFIEGDVPIPLYPEWARTDDALASVAVLLRSLHDASTRIDLTSGTWSAEMADGLGAEGLSRAMFLSCQPRHGSLTFEGMVGPVR